MPSRPDATPAAGGPAPSPAPPSPTPSPAPTAGVLGEVGTAEAPPPAPPGGASPGDGPPGGTPDRWLTAFAASIPGPAGLDLDPNVIVTNLALTAIFILLFALTAEILNSTLDAHRDEIHAWWQRLLAGPLRILTPVAVVDARLGDLSESGKAGTVLHGVVVLALVGLIYGFLSTDFGLNAQSLMLLVALMLGIGFVTYLVEGTSSLLAVRRHGARATVRLYGTAVLVAIASVVFSRLVAFEPGLVYGFVASSLILTPLALAKRDEAMLVFIPALLLLGASLVAFALLGPASESATSGGWQGSLVQTILAVIFIAGLEGLVFTMLPLRFMDGAVVMRWSRLAWAAIFGTAVFLWWQLLLNRDQAYLDSFRQSSVHLVAIGLILFMCTTGLVWGYFRFRPQPGGAAEA